MKVGIFTLPFHSNYGGILQAWALQETLKKMGHDPVVFRQPGFHVAWAFQPIAIARRALLRFRGSSVPLLARVHDERLEHNIVRFCRERIMQSPLLANDAERVAFVRKESLEAVVAGSDQIWRPGVTNPSYFLAFLEGVPDVRRIAYAASFGCDRPDFGTEEHRYAELLTKFDAISVREDDAVSLCKKVADVVPEHTVDPTLLLSRTDYETIATPKRDSRPVGYFLAGAKHFQALMDRLPHRFSADMNILATASDEVDALIPAPMPSVEAWLGTIASASCVLTDSFHGTVFAILFRKPFVSLDNGSGVGRIRSLLHLLGIDCRLVVGSSSADSVADLLQQPLPEEAYARLNALNRQSWMFLENALR